MSSAGRGVETADEMALLSAASNGMVVVVTSLLQEGICPNIYWVCVWANEERERETNEERGRRKKD